MIHLIFTGVINFGTTNYMDLLGGIMDEIQDKTIKELLDSLNNSIEDIREHPTKIDRIPSNFEIMIRGVSDSKAIDMLFSPKIDNFINSMLSLIESGDFEKVLSNTDNLTKMLDNIFGKGAFKGKISNAVLGNIQASIQSQKYQTMKSRLGKVFTALKKKNLVIKNLKRGVIHFDKDSNEYKKYKEAVSAIKSVVKFIERIYMNRKLINRKVFNGLNHIVHETFEYDEPLR